MNKEINYCVLTGSEFIKLPDGIYKLHKNLDRFYICYNSNVCFYSYSISGKYMGGVDLLKSSELEFNECVNEMCNLLDILFK